MSFNKVRYRSGNQTFSNKALAFEHHFKYDTEKVMFEFAHASFDTCDFAVEPQESFDELCKQRALQIRDSTPYLAVAYSGGSDSNHLIDCFVRNNIKIDEIVMLKDNILTSTNLPHPQNWEIDNHAIPYIKSLNLDCKITVYDVTITESELENFLNYDSQFLFNRHDSYDVTIINWLKFQKDRPDLIFTCGSTEPRVGYDNKVDKYYSFLYDTDNLRFRTHITSDFMPFYTDPAFPKLHIKQCHIMKNFFREHGHDGYIEGSENTLQPYKELAIKLTRYNSFDTSSSPYFVKRKESIDQGNFLKKLMADFKTKTWLTYLSRINPNLAEMYVTSMKQTIDNFPIYALPVGVPIYKKKYLE